MKKSITAILIAFFIIMLAESGARAGTVLLGGAARDFPLGPGIEYLEDPDGTLTYEDVSSVKHAGRFKKNADAVINLGFTSSAYWFRWVVENHDSRYEHWLLELGYPHHDYIELYAPDAAGSVKKRTAGDNVLFSKREVLHRHFLFNLQIPRGTSLPVYLRIKTDSSFQVPLQLWEPTAFTENVNTEQFGFGIYYGLMLVMVLYNLFLFIGIRDRVYLLYVVFILAFILGQMSLNGLAFEYLWFHFPWWANRSILLFLFMSIFMSVVFCRAYLVTRENTPRMDKALIALAAVSAVGMVLSFIAPYAWGVRLVALCASVILIPSLGAAIICYRKNVPAARWYLIAWGALMLGVMVLGLRNLGLLPTFFLTSYSIQIGSAMEVVLLSLGLADRINHMKKEKFMAQQDALHSHMKLIEAQKHSLEQLQEMDRMKDRMNQELEQKVEQRTEELRATLEEMEAINEQLLLTQNELWGEMQLAKKIQTSLLPNEPRIPGFTIAAHMEPASEVGGDYYDIINLKHSNWVIIGDVSGHGVSAGLVMMMVQTAMQTILRGTPDIRPSLLLRTVDRAINYNVRKLQEDKYMTITALQISGDRVVMFSGLHQDILIFRAAENAVETIETNGLWLGLDIDLHRDALDYNFRMETGDVMLLYTDGITEAHDGDGVSMFGSGRLTDLLRDNGRSEPKGIRDAILLSLKEYTVIDDVTMVILKKD